MIPFFRIKSCTFAPAFELFGHWRDGRVVDYSSLENYRTERYRGFESLSLRNITWLSVICKIYTQFYTQKKCKVGCFNLIRSKRLFWLSAYCLLWVNRIILKNPIYNRYSKSLRTKLQNSRAPLALYTLAPISDNLSYPLLKPLDPSKKMYNLFPSFK